MSFDFEDDMMEQDDAQYGLGTMQSEQPFEDSHQDAQHAYEQEGGSGQGLYDDLGLQSQPSAQQSFRPMPQQDYQQPEPPPPQSPPRQPIASPPKSAPPPAPSAPGQPPAQPPPPQPPAGPPPPAVSSALQDAKDSGCCVYVANMTWFHTDAELEAQCAEAAGTNASSIKSIRFIEDRATGKSKGCALVEFREPEDAVRCKEQLHGRTVRGRSLVVTFQSKSFPKAGGGGFGGGGFGRGRGRDDGFAGRGGRGGGGGPGGRGPGGAGGGRFGGPPPGLPPPGVMGDMPGWPPGGFGPMGPPPLDAMSAMAMMQHGGMGMGMGPGAFGGMPFMGMPQQPFM